MQTVLGSYRADVDLDLHVAYGVLEYLGTLWSTPASQGLCTKSLVQFNNPGEVCERNSDMRCPSKYQTYYSSTVRSLASRESGEFGVWFPQGEYFHSRVASSCHQHTSSMWLASLGRDYFLGKSGE